jgi:hypothetical protein
VPLGISAGGHLPPPELPKRSPAHAAQSEPTQSGGTAPCDAAVPYLAVSTAVLQRHARVESLFSDFFSLYSYRQRETRMTSQQGGDSATMHSSADGAMEGMEPLPPAVPAARAAAASLSLPPHLLSLATDLQAATRYRQFRVASVLQHNSSAVGALQGGKMVCSVTLDRVDEYLATVGVSPTAQLCFNCR